MARATFLELSNKERAEHLDPQHNVSRSVGNATETPHFAASSTACPKAAALVVGHSPTNEAAVLGLTGEVVAPLAKGAGVRVIAGDDGYRVEPIE